MVTYTELVEVFVRKRGWYTKLLNADLSELAEKKHPLSRYWLETRDGGVRAYRVNEEHMKYP
jgi:hypothetical protein